VEQLLDLDNVAGAWKTVAAPFWVRVMLIERVFSTPPSYRRAAI
jgi:hypothetical protein